MTKVWFFIHNQCILKLYFFFIFQNYLINFVEVCRQSPSSSLQAAKNPYVSKQFLCECEPFFKKGIFETTKHGTTWADGVTVPVTCWDYARTYLYTVSRVINSTMLLSPELHVCDVLIFSGAYVHKCKFLMERFLYTFMTHYETAYLQDIFPWVVIFCSMLF